MNSHRQYLSLGVVLAEYMTKSCLAYLPPGEQQLCDRMLRGAGIDLQSVGLGTVGQTAMALAVTNAGLQQPQRLQPRPTPRPMPPPSAGGLAALHEAMDELQTIAAMHCPLPRGAHVRFLALLLEPAEQQPQPHHTAISVQEASAQAYGREGAVWVRGGLFGAPPLERLSLSDLEAAYARWHALAVRGTGLMRAADLLPLGRI
jgi:hypothetical protein